MKTCSALSNHLESVIAASCGCAMSYPGDLPVVSLSAPSAPSAKRLGRAWPKPLRTCVELSALMCFESAGATLCLFFTNKSCEFVLLFFCDHVFLTIFSQQDQQAAAADWARLDFGFLRRLGAGLEWDQWDQLLHSKSCPVFYFGRSSQQGFSLEHSKISRVFRFLDCLSPRYWKGFLLFFHP